MKIMKAIFSGIWWLGRGTATVMGLALLPALTVGLASTALASTGVGARFDPGKINAVDAVSELAGTTNNALLRIANDSKGPNATALELRTDPQEAAHEGRLFRQGREANCRPPGGRGADQFANGVGGTAVDADKLDGRDSASFADGTGGKANDADNLDGLDSTQIGINGYTFVRDESAFDSNPFKFASANCPSGKQIIGGGGRVLVSTSDPNRNLAPVALSTNGVDLNGFDHYDVSAVEVAPYGFEWKVYAMAVCAKVGNP